MTVEEVLELLSDAEEVEEMEVSNEWEDDELDLVDDPDEPIMEGSDDEVSDLGEIDEDEDDDIPVRSQSNSERWHPASLHMYLLFRCPLSIPRTPLQDNCLPAPPSHLRVRTSTTHKRSRLHAFSHRFLSQH